MLKIIKPWIKDVLEIIRHEIYMLQCELENETSKLFDSNGLFSQNTKNKELIGFRNKRFKYFAVISETKQKYKRVSSRKEVEISEQVFIKQFCKTHKALINDWHVYLSENDLVEFTLEERKPVKEPETTNEQPFLITVNVMLAEMGFKRK